MKRNNESFALIQGYVSKELALKFKSQAVLADLSLSEAVEQAVTLWIDQQEIKDV